MSGCTIRITPRRASSTSRPATSPRAATTLPRRALPCSCAGLRTSPRRGTSGPRCTICSGAMTNACATFGAPSSSSRGTLGRCCISPRSCARRGPPRKPASPCRRRARSIPTSPSLLTIPDWSGRSGNYNAAMSVDHYSVTVAKDLQDLIPVFMSNRHQELDALRVALAAADFEKLRQLGHRMKGVGSSYGFVHVSTLGKYIEEGARSGDRAALHASISEYDDYLSKVQIAYE